MSSSGMIAAMDETVGNITDALKQKGFMDNAILVFTTDVSSESVTSIRNHALLNVMNKCPFYHIL